jgi:hypothetical protein
MTVHMEQLRRRQRMLRVSTFPGTRRWRGG